MNGISYTMYRDLQNVSDIGEIQDFLQKVMWKNEPQMDAFERPRLTLPILHQQVEENFAWLNENDVNFTYPGHENYPPSFLRLEKPPLFLSYRGTPVWKSHFCMSVVGSREASPLSLKWMDIHLSPLVKRGLALVSGGARGIDQRAHQICVRQGAPTVVFLPCGLDHCYPPNFMDWIDPILDAGGAIVSELSPFTPMRKHYFHLRNRMIVGLSDVLLVVEANRRSGSMMSARLAIASQKTVAVVPGFPMESHWSGSVDLLCEGVFAIRDYEDLIVLNELSSPRSPQKPNS